MTDTAICTWCDEETRHTVRELLDLRQGVDPLAVLDMLVVGGVIAYVTLSIHFGGCSK